MRPSYMQRNRCVIGCFLFSLPVSFFPLANTRTRSEVCRVGSGVTGARFSFVNQWQNLGCPLGCCFINRVIEMRGPGRVGRGLHEQP